jgi:hypothetical protein
MVQTRASISYQKGKFTVAVLGWYEIWFLVSPVAEIAFEADVKVCYQSASILLPLQDTNFVSHKWMLEIWTLWQRK